ncbi:MAG TPA: ROK family protein [Candidatus Saccharimonadales bacterium]|nr:ROK family protein [Candidatus Saccharimonadales bacterium]
MDLAIDIGGTKTLIAVFDGSGRKIAEYKFPTSKNYEQFTKELDAALSANFANYQIKAVCCAAPGELDRSRGIGVVFGNLPWKNVPLKQDLQKLFPGAAVFIENDAKLAGLSEAVLLQKKYKKVLYLTISTGIGDGIIIDDKIDPDFTDSEPGQMVLEYNGQLQKWEDFASGRALVKRYGKKASEIDDPVIWEAYAKGIARGLNELLAILQPDVVVIGGGVGTHFDKFSSYLLAELAKMENDMVKTPPIIKAQRPEEAVIYGCYELIRQTQQ